ncbi:hypothetical protein HZC31_04890 [Candidatus Woesearchaeota archaeon]|nr:hypothetical protein [Candidatus Woesearchaeota archaeon]
MENIIAIIGGTGFSDKITATQQVDTDYGLIEAGTLEIGGTTAYILTRHSKLDVPHRVNYRGNVQAAKLLGTTMMYGISAAGRLHADVLPGHLVAVDDFDWDDVAPQTFAEDGNILLHVSMNPSNSEGLRKVLHEAWTKVEQKVRDRYREASQLAVGYHQDGTYFNIHGPGFSTAAREEAIRRRGDNHKVIGQTLHTEAYLAREMQIAYAGIAMCVDHSNYPDAPQHVNHGDVVMQAVPATADAAYMLLDAAIRKIPASFEDPAHTALRHALLPEQVHLGRLEEVRPRLADILRKELKAR